MVEYMTTLLLDSDGDLEFNELKKPKLTLTNAEKVLQDVKIALKTIRTEDIFSPEFGLDMLKIKSYSYNKQLIDAEIRTALMKYKYLKSIDSIEIGLPDDNRKVSCNINITTTSDLSLAIGVEV